MNRKIIAATGAAALLFLAGCSSSSDDAGSAASTPAQAATSAAATPMESSAMASESAAAGTIVEVASANSDFSTLVAAVKAAGLVETLSGTGPFTVFAPTNEAFAALPAGVLDALLLPENKDTLTKILTYHVVSGEVPSDAVKPGDVETVEGSKITITTDGGKVKVNDANVTAVDVEASNGVIHVIDAVLVPEDVDVAALTK